MSAAAADLLQARTPDLDPQLLDYLTDYLKDPSSTQSYEVDGGEELDSLVRPALEGEGVPADEVEALLADLMRLMGSGTATKSSAHGPAKLDKVVTLNNGPALHATLLTGAVDITSATKGRETQVDLRKLEKAEAKLKVKADKRAKRTGLDLYEGSKLVDAAKAQAAYEATYMEVNPLHAFDATNKGKSKDIHLENIDLSFGSLRILNGGNLTLAHGRRYGIIGRNGIGKSTLLRAMSVREVAIPCATAVTVFGELPVTDEAHRTHISVLYVEQEVHGDDTSALQAVLSADVWRERLLAEERELSDTATDTGAKRLAEVHQLLQDIDADTGPARAAELLYGLGFSTEDQSRPTRSFSGGWRMRLSLARALFCKPDLLMLDEPSNNLDINALAWLEDYLATTWPNTLVVVSHDRAFLDQVATDIVHQHSQRLDYYKGNFTQFYHTRSERALAQRREYEAQQAYRAHLQAFVDRWRYNANRAAQAQSKLKIIEKLPDLEPPEADDVVKFSFAEADKLSPPVLQLNEVDFAYGDRRILAHASIDVQLDSRVGVIGPNGAGKSTLLKLLIGELEASNGIVTRNGRLRIAYFAQHQIDSLPGDVNPVAFLASRFPGQTETEYRKHLGSFGITGTTGLQLINTLSGGQKSRVAFSVLSMQRPHVLVLDEPTNHLDVEAMDALIAAVNKWNGGVLVVSHDTRFINSCCKDLYVVADGKVYKHKGDVESYKQIILANAKSRPNA